MAPTVPKDRTEPTADRYGVGMNADGTLNVLTAEQYAKAVADRNAEEELDGTQMPEQEEDFADLMGGEVVSVGGRLIEIKRLEDRPHIVRLWVVDRDGTETCVLARPAAVMPKIGEGVWWQGRRVYFDQDRQELVKVGYSFPPPKNELRAG